MSHVFPEPIRNLPKADIPLPGVEAYLSSGEGHQIVFVTFRENVTVPEHTHADQWEVVLEGKVEVWIDGEHHVFTKGDKFYIPAGIRHQGRVHAGYAAMMFFAEKDRYKAKS